MPLVKPIRDASVQLEEHFQSERLNYGVNCNGFPSRDAHRDGSEGFWRLSESSYLLQKTLPVFLPGDEGDEDEDDPCFVYEDVPDGNLWLFSDKVYYTADRLLTAEDVRALINVDVNKRRLTLEKAHALQAMVENSEQPRKRQSVPQSVRLEVWQRDAGKCVDCSSQDRLEFDHIIPVSMGGANTARNIQLLCETCNRRKGASLG